MYNSARPVTGRFLAALLLMNLSACGWVDSTGVQGTTVGLALRDAQPVAIIEGTSLTAPLAGEGADLSNWRWEPDESDVRSQCAAIGDFEEQLSATSLADACSQDRECSVAVEELESENSATVFTLTMPALRSPVALNYRLMATRDDGTIIERQQLLCGLSVNEAPVANDDSYLALPNELLIINPSDSNNLLANDDDDDDIRNMELSVTGVVQQPGYASQFSYDDKGGFIYAADESVPVNGNGIIEDSFVYTITDGMHVTQGTAFIRIAPGNTAPTQRQAVPDLTIQAETVSSAPEILEFDLSRYFFDADGDALDFTISSEQLPASGNIYLSSDGLLYALPTALDIGSYRLEIEVSDGIDTVSDTFILTIAAPQPTARNHTPDVTDIDNQLVQGRFTYDISVFFSDIDNDELTFTATGLPQDVFISSSGVITGQANSDNRGIWLIRVTADDGNGGTVSDGFRLLIRSSAAG